MEQYSDGVVIHSQGHGWDTSIREMAVAAIKLETLSSAPNSEVSITRLFFEDNYSQDFNIGWPVDCQTHVANFEILAKNINIIEMFLFWSLTLRQTNKGVKHLS